ncbi:MAG: MATE family efflux transporter, partial [Mariniblastus sp.]|nr:MATE family efflux transporter [Mariniblastus sp.]
VTSVTIYVFASQLVQIFTDDAAVIEIGVECLHIIMLVQWSYVMTSTHLAMLQATKRPRYGFFESVLRKVLLPLPFFFFFVWSWQFEIAAVWWIISGTNVFMTVITVIYAQWVLRHLGRAKMGV